MNVGMQSFFQPTFQSEMQSMMSMIAQSQGEQPMGECQNSQGFNPAGVLNNAQAQQGNNSFLGFWEALLSGQMGGPQVGDSMMNGETELQNPASPNNFGGTNSSLQAPGSTTQAQVLPDGTLNVSIPRTVPMGTVAAGGFACQGGGNQAAGMFAAEGVQNSPTAPLDLQFKNGNIMIGGKTIPFGNTGVIVKLPTGESIGVGRNSSNDANQIRWAMAGPGQQIPTSPAGATNVFTLDASGNLVPSGQQ